MATYFAVMGVAVASIVPVPVKRLWNASASTPLGLYDLTAQNGLKVGDLVAVRPKHHSSNMRSRGELV